MSDPPAVRTWRCHLPGFLRAYVQRHGVRRVRLYLGFSTAYMQVASLAIRPLLDRGLCAEADGCDVELGNAYHTPYNHGLLLAQHLGLVARSALTRRRFLRL